MLLFRSHLTMLAIIIIKICYVLNHDQVPYSVDKNGVPGHSIFNGLNLSQFKIVFKKISTKISIIL